MLHGFPPKVIWLRLGNCTTNDVERTVRNGLAAIEAPTIQPSVSSNLCEYRVRKPCDEHHPTLHAEPTSLCGGHDRGDFESWIRREARLDLAVQLG
ncbi:MAG: hypothetical protein M5U01_23820 [Ardenticatenaceae bacterium]|nr:hypothetical protein [Ardenticatenaceae bacterium]